MPVLRVVKNIVKNYTDAEVKVREATSNDPWGPSSTLMSEIADLTYNVVAFTEIMQMIWKRLNDHGKNWRHVYKSLTLLEYIIKTGSEKVAQQCKENIFAIQTLKDFQHIEDNKDHGVNVREKAKALVALLKDDDRLKNERAKALKAKERFSENFGIGSDSTQTHLAKPRHGRNTASSEGQPQARLPAEMEEAVPSSVGEEELQLQLALAMSKEEADNEAKKRTNDDLKLQLALEESQKGKEPTSEIQKRLQPNLQQRLPAPIGKRHLLDLGGAFGGGAASSASNDPWAPSQPVATAATDPWATPQPEAKTDPWATAASVTAAPGQDEKLWGAPVQSTTTNDPWASATPSAQANQGQPVQGYDPWGSNGGPTPQPAATIDDDFDALISRPATNSETASGDPYAMNSLSDTLPPSNNTAALGENKRPEHFLGANAGLVNLDSLVTKPPGMAGSATVTSTQPGMVNPFSSSQPVSSNPFAAQQPAPLSLNQMSATSSTQSNFNTSSQQTALPNPMLPLGGYQPVPAAGYGYQTQQQSNLNPFL